MEHSKIENIQQLRKELARLKAEAELQEQKIYFNFEKVKEDLKPENIIRNLFSELVSKNSVGKNILLRVVNFAISLFFQRMAIRTEHKIEEKLFSAFGSVLERIKHFFKRKRKGSPNGQS
jgi:hypothetical protein